MSIHTGQQLITLQIPGEDTAVDQVVSKDVTKGGVIRGQGRYFSSRDLGNGGVSRGQQGEGTWDRDARKSDLILEELVC